MHDSLVTIAYLVAAVLFILSLGGLSHQKTSRRGNAMGIAGMLLALLTAVLSHEVTLYGWLILAMLPAAALGAVMAARVRMTQMPQMVALLHSFVGAAAVLVGFASLLVPHLVYDQSGADPEKAKATALLVHNIEVFVGVGVGAITFTGSIVAYLKLNGNLSGKPLTLPARHLLNLLILGVTVALGAWFVGGHDPSLGVVLLIIATVLTGIFGIHMVMAIGGADMPVVVSMLNSYSGWAAAAAGFMLGNDLLIITGALVGSSGAILSYIMCKGMNRSFISVILGGFGTDDGGGGGGSDEAQGDVTSIEAAAAADLMRNSKSIVIVPGYGMAVAQAQHALAEVVKKLRDAGVEVRFAIHPVAGRLPGHMNVLLAEANVPYDIVLEMEEINDDLPGTDLALVIGANDIVNPSAETDPHSAIAGMPVLQVWNSTDVIMMKRGMASGYAGVGNPLFFHENTSMLFGDAKENIDLINAALDD